MTKDQEYQITECLRELEAGVTPNQLLSNGYAAGAIIEALTRKYDMQIRTQEHNIKVAWAELAAVKKRDEHAQAYIPQLKAKIAELEAQLTPEAIAERVLSNAGSIT